MDDFKIDSGINIDEVIDFENDGDNEGKHESQPEVNRHDYKKTAVITAVIGFLVVLIALGLANHFRYKGEKDSLNEAVKPSNNEVVQKQQIEQPTEELIKPQEVMENWIEFKDDQGLEFDVKIKAMFTVTDIRHYAKVVSPSQEVSLKSVVKGSISGLSGTYEVELPYSKAKYLKIGDRFEIEYTCAVKDGIKFIGEIQY